MRTFSELDNRALALAIIDALNLWSHPRYRSFLHDVVPGKLDDNWFKWFIGEWSVARTIKADKQKLIVEYLNTKFRQDLIDGKGGSAVDQAAKYIRDMKWTSQKRKDGTASSPISLVSKIGFFLNPDYLIPYDSYARMGLNKHLVSKKEGGDGTFRGKNYSEYLAIFNRKFELAKKSIVTGLDEKWVTELANKLSCELKYLKMIRMQRKVFDNYLVHVGGKDYVWKSAS